MFSPSRDQARRFFFDTWKKYRAGESLSSLEQIALTIVSLHPEYHVLLEDTERNLDRDFTPTQGGLNPFLHLSLHLAVEEQLAIDQPPGLRANYERLCESAASEHEAKHTLVECLGETIWQSQRSGAPPDAAAYLECVRKSVRS